MRRRVLVAVAAACLLAGCGDSADEDAVRAALTEYTTAMLAGDGAKACARMTPELQEFVTNAYPEARDCKAAVAAIDDHVSAAGGEIEIDDIEVDGDSASALVSSGDEGRGSRQFLRKLSGSWRVDVAPRNTV